MSALAHNVLVLGTGFISGPLYDYLTKHNDTFITAVSVEAEELKKLSQKYKNICTVRLDVERETSRLEKLVQENDLVVSLLPYPLHPLVATCCINNKKNLVTCSYATSTMKQYHKAAVDAGISILMEVGLDPGIDHMLAMECFADIKERGGKISSYVSWCGGLPAPESANNTLRYKFSWSPMGVLLGTLSSSKYLLNGKVIEFNEGGENYRNGIVPIDFMPELNLEGIANGDSTDYQDKYNLSNAHTILRGTLRYKGFADAFVGLQNIGVISKKTNKLLTEDYPDLTWRQFVSNLLNAKETISDIDLKNLVYKAVDNSKRRLKVIEELGLLSDARVDKTGGTSISSLAAHLSSRLSYATGDRDMVVMRMEVGATFENKKTEQHSVELVAYGDPGGYSAMSKTAGFPCAIAARMLLQAKIKEKGILIPINQEIYVPLLHELRALGITTKSTIA